MAELYGIFVDLDLCTGCHACEIACKQENSVPVGTRWIKVVHVGPEELDGKLRMDFMPVMTDGCTFCEHRINQNLEPRCVGNCPTQALYFCQNYAEILSVVRDSRRLQLCKLEGEVPAFG